MLYPQDNEAREVKDLSGIWRFRVDRDGVGHRDQWFARPLADPIDMPVPSSYNDLTQDAGIRDHIGDVWYERTFFVPASWKGQRVCLRFASAEHTAAAWVNGSEAVRHRGGFLPFAADVSDTVRYGEENRVTVAVNNELSWDLLPTGFVKTYDDANHPPGYRTLEYHFDFFNYAGLNRPVVLTATPKTYIEDVLIRTTLSGGDAEVAYEITLGGGTASLQTRLLDEEGREVARSEGAKGVLNLPAARLWAPGDAYLYILECRATDTAAGTADVYREPFGVRTVEVAGDQFLINGKPFYFQGCCKHEDMDLKGRGLDLAVLVKDFNLMRWIGANSFRTSHYPYSEEIMRMADRAGIVVIDEAPAVGMRAESPSVPTYSEERISSRTLAHHLKVMGELIRRDKNHPCVVMWSMANEPIANEPKAGDYFRAVAEETRRLDPTRPVTMVTEHVGKVEECYPFPYVDVMCINRYHSWYSDPGHLGLIEMQTVGELSLWYNHFRKPLIVSEYGGDTVAGLHADPPVMFSEEYQVAMLENFQKGFDRLPFVIGEHVWNFADFATKQGITRVLGNRKGVFTRQRQPKAAAHALRARWHQPRRKTT